MGTYYEPSIGLRADKNNFGASRRARWFGSRGDKRHSGAGRLARWLGM